LFQCRLLEMSRLKYAQNSRTDDDLIAMTKRVHVAKVFTLKEFNKKIDQIEWEILRYNTKNANSLEITLPYSMRGQSF